MVPHVRQTCRCGAVEIHADVPAKSAGTHIMCFCRDCQTAANLYDNSDIVSPAGGSEGWQTTPDRISIVKGAEHLRVLRLSPKGLLRWHSSCCNTPMLNTLPNLKLPFVSMVLRQSKLAEAAPVIGPATCYASVASARPGSDAPRRDVGFKRTAVAVAYRMALAWISRRARNSPLHHGDGTPIAPVDVISLSARNAACPDHLKNTV